MQRAFTLPVIAVLFLISTCLSAWLHFNSCKSVTVTIPVAPITVVSNVINFDTVSATTLHDSVFEIKVIEFVNNHKCVIKSSQKNPTNDSIKLIFTNVQLMTQPIRIKSYNSFFDYFQEYDKLNFSRYFATGGLALLFFFSLIILIVTRIPLILSYNLIAGYNLLLVILREFHFGFLTYISFDSLSNVLLFILLLLITFLLRFYEEWKSRTKIALKITPMEMAFGLIYLSLQLFLFQHPVVLWINRLIIFVVMMYVLILTVKTIKPFFLRFKVYIILGYCLMMIQWAETFHVFNFATSFFVWFILLIMTLLAITLSLFNLEEFSRTVEKNQQNMRLQKQLGQLQIISLERERKRMFEQLDQDILTKLNFFSQENEIKGKLTKRILESKIIELLQAVRDYSYSLFPPYLEKLTLQQLFEREIEKKIPKFQKLVKLFIDYEIDTNLNSQQKLWLYRVFQSYLHFYELESQERQIKIELFQELNNEIVLKLTHEITNLNRPIYRSYRQSDLLSYTEYLKATWNTLLTESEQGWYLSFTLLD